MRVWGRCNAPHAIYIGVEFLSNNFVWLFSRVLGLKVCATLTQL